MILRQIAAIVTAPLKLAEAATIPIRPHNTTYPPAEANTALLNLKADRLNGTGVLVNDQR